MKTFVQDSEAGLLDIHVKISGSGLPVLLIHPEWSAGYAWRHQLASLHQAGYQTIVPDLAGFGQSSLLQPFEQGHRRQAVLLRRLIGSFDIPQVMVVGHGFGGRIAMALAALYPDFVVRLVLVNTAIEAPQPFGWWGRTNRNWALRNAFSSEKSLSQYLDRWNGSALTPDMQQLRWQDYQLPENRQTLMQFPAFGKDFPICRELHWISCPVRMIWSDNDPQAPLSCARRLHDRLHPLGVPELELEVLAGHGHLLPEKAPEAFNPLLVQALHGTAHRILDAGRAVQLFM